MTSPYIPQNFNSISQHSVTSYLNSLQLEKERAEEQCLSLKLFSKNHSFQRNHVEYKKTSFARKKTADAHYISEIFEKFQNDKNSIAYQVYII